MAKSRINQAYELRPIYSIRDLTDLVTEIGFLPFFQNVIQGFSIDEAIPAEAWDAYLGLGPWLWRDDIAREKKCIYGKFFIVPVDFIFAFDENGEKKYSYGTTVYDLPERWLGEDACRSRYDCSPEESLDRCIRRLMKMLPDLEYENAKRLLASQIEWR